MTTTFLNSRLNALLAIFSIVLIIPVGSVLAQGQYKIQPGDALTVSVWKEPDLTGDILVHPDGTFSIPLIGSIDAGNRTLDDIQAEAASNLSKYIPDPVVTIGLKESVGTQIYVLGQVNAPGVFTVTKPTDVMQALSLAEGMTSYASANKIRILRRTKGKQIAIDFRYGDVEKGANLRQNIVLQDGDTVVVP